MIRTVLPTWSWFPGMKMAGHCQDCSSIIATFRSSTGRAPLECQKSPRKIIPAFLHPQRFLSSALYSEQARECSPFLQDYCLWAMLKNKLWNKYRNKCYKKYYYIYIKIHFTINIHGFLICKCHRTKVLKSHLASAAACTVWSTWRQMSHVRRLKCRSEKTTHNSGSAHMSFFWVHNHQKKILSLCAWMLAVEVKKCSLSYGRSFYSCFVLRNLFQFCLHSVFSSPIIYNLVSLAFLWLCWKCWRP